MEILIQQIQHEEVGIYLDDQITDDDLQELLPRSEDNDVSWRKRFRLFFKNRGLKISDEIASNLYKKHQKVIRNGIVGYEKT